MRGLLIIMIAIAILGCGEKPAEKSQLKQVEKLKVVCTTGMIGDAVDNIVGDLMDVKSLMGPGVDPHLYKATQSDVKHLMEADIIVYNGLHLEGKMGEIFEKLKENDDKLVIEMAEDLEHDRIRKTSEFESGEDPHIWFDVALWMEAINHLNEELLAEDITNAFVYDENYNAYITKLQHLHEWTTLEVQKIPEDQRILITAHDAFGYFGLAYGMEVRGLQGISTSSEFGLQDRLMLTDFILEKQIKSLFVESSVPQKSIEAVVESCQSKGHAVTLGGTLYSDAMGDANSEAGNYIGMVTANVNTIVNALK